MGGVPPLALRTDLKLKVYGKREPASAGYVQFLSKDRELTPADRRGSGGGIKIRWLAAFHGYLPLLQELLAGFDWIGSDTTKAAGEYSYSQSPLLLVLASDLFLAFSSSQRREANWRPCSG